MAIGRPKWMKPVFARHLSNEIRNVLGRGAFLRDYGSVVHSSHFRRLSKKTQVYSNPNNDHVRTRLTHSLEVEQIARQLCRFFIQRLIEKKIPLYDNFSLEFEDLVAAASLSHDLGHPPFGHTGQKILNDLCSQHSPDCEFDDNKQVVRIFLSEQLEPDISVSAPLVAAVIKKMGKASYDEEKQSLKSVMEVLSLNEIRHPASYLMEAADDIAYMSSDLQDALAVRFDRTDEYQGLISCLMALPKLNDNFRFESDLMRVFEDKEIPIRKKTTYFLRALLHHTLNVLEEALEGVSALDDLPEAMHTHIIKKCDKERFNEKGELNFLFASSCQMDAKAILEVKSRVYAWILSQKYIGEQDIIARNVLSEIWDCLLEIETTKDKSKSSMRLLPSEYRERLLKIDNSKENVRRILVDFIAGMTDRFAIDFWNRIQNPERLRLVS